ncbi:MAG: ketoacyl-ACP synthase III [Chloroflexi bacterium]|nr:ketoacyl-ACP synthase III [Chloroflexota bacterium]
MAERYGNIVGWGKYVPDRVVTNADFEKRLDTSDEWIVARTGIRERRHASEGEVTSQMSTAAAREALGIAGLRPSDLDLIIVATSTPDYLTPPVSSQIQHLLGAGHVGAFTLVTGCTGFVYALATAQQFIASGSVTNALVIGVEIISRFVDWEDRATCILFGDGAGAVVVQATDEPCGVLSFDLGSDGSGAEHLILPAGGAAIPVTHEALVKKQQYLRMNGNEVFKFATRVLGKSLRQAIAKAGLTADDIDLIVPHQANVRIIESAARQAKLPMEKVFVNIHKYGNTSAASIPIALCEALEEGRARVGDTLAFVSFGAGLTWATAIVKLAERKQPVSRRKRWFSFLGWFIRDSSSLRSSE